MITFIPSSFILKVYDTRIISNQARKTIAPTSLSLSLKTAMFDRGGKERFTGGGERGEEQLPQERKQTQFRRSALFERVHDVSPALIIPRINSE